MVYSVNQMFENIIPTDKLIELTTLLKNGGLKTDLPRVLKLALWISGSTIETFYPAIENFVSSLEEETPETLAAQIVQEGPEEGEVSANAINPLLFLLIARLAAQLLQGKK